jgi:hypothetical protein
VLHRDGNPTPLGEAFQMYGRIFKSLHILACLDDENYRRDIKAIRNLPRCWTAETPDATAIPRPTAAGLMSTVERRQVIAARADPAGAQPPSSGREAVEKGLARRRESPGCCGGRRAARGDRERLAGWLVDSGLGALARRRRAVQPDGLAAEDDRASRLLV